MGYQISDVSITNYGQVWVKNTTAPTFNDYGYIAISDSGQYQIIAFYQKPLYISLDGGYSWNTDNVNKNYLGVAISDDARYQTILVGSVARVSSNTGGSWSDYTFTTTLTSVSMSKSGQYQLLSINNFLYRSKNYGADDWTQILTAEHYFYDVSVSKNGKYQIVGWQYQFHRMEHIKLQLLQLIFILLVIVD